NTGGAEHCVGDQAGADIPDGQAVRLGISENIIGGLSAAATGHELGDNDRLAGNVFAQKRNQCLSAQRSRAAGLASLNQHDGFSLEVGSGLSEDRRSWIEANHEGDQCWKNSGWSHHFDFLIRGITINDSSTPVTSFFW